MTAQAPLMLQACGTATVLMWLVAFGLYVADALRVAETAGHLQMARLLTRLGLLIGTAGWAGYVALTWPPLPWRAAWLPPLALAALAIYTLLARRVSKSPVSPCLYGCAVVAYGVALASWGAGNGEALTGNPRAWPLIAIRELAAVVAAGTLLTYGTGLLIRHPPPQALAAARAEQLGDGTLRIALWGTLLALAAAAGRAWLVWGEVARADVVTLFIAWAFIMAASLWQMMTGMSMTRMVHGLALAALVLLGAMFLVTA